MASTKYSQLQIAKNYKAGGRHRLRAVNKILSPLINKSTIMSDIENKKVMKQELSEYGFCFTGPDDHKRNVFRPSGNANQLEVGFTEALGDINFLSAFERSASPAFGTKARDITFGTRFPKIRACYFEQWLDDSDNSYLHKIYLHLMYSENRDDPPRQFYAIHCDPDLTEPHPMYNGITHVHVGDDKLSGMHIVTALTSKGITFTNIDESDRSFALAVRQVCKELDREKFTPFAL